MKLYRDADISTMNTFRMKVKAACVIEYYSIEELEEISKIDDLPKPFLHIGGGSNLLFLKDFPGTILHSHLCFIQPFPAEGGITARVGAGVPWDDFCSWCAERDLWGPENLSGIPGETGSAAVQNIGAYGREIKDIVSMVECYDLQEHRQVAFRNEECKYGYRDSFFKNEGKGRYIITAVSVTLKRDYSPVLDYGNVKDLIISKCGRFVVYDDGLTPSLMRRAITDIRKEKLPAVKDYGSAGSFFRNPYVPKEIYDRIAGMGLGNVPGFPVEGGLVKIPAAWLIDKCGWKGYTEGNAGVWEKQPLVLYNVTGQASPEEIKSLEDKIVASVKEKFQVELTPEVEHI